MYSDRVALYKQLEEAFDSKILCISQAIAQT